MDGATGSYVIQLLFLRFLTVVVALPTLGHVDRNRLETYEDLSNETNRDLFGNLTFRFSCEDKPIGLYADSDYGCRIFHVCDDAGKGFPVICPSEMFFNQQERICTDDAENVDCERAREWFYLNELPYSLEVTEEYSSSSIEEEEVPSVLPLLPS